MAETDQRRVLRLIRDTGFVRVRDLRAHGLHPEHLRRLVAGGSVIERLLYRVSESPHADDFVLKGAMLFAVWTGALHRPTRDLDLLGFGEPSAERLARVFWGHLQSSGGR